MGVDEAETDAEGVTVVESDEDTLTLPLEVVVSEGVEEKVYDTVSVGVGVVVREDDEETVAVPLFVKPTVTVTVLVTVFVVE